MNNVDGQKLSDYLSDRRNQITRIISDLCQIKDPHPEIVAYKERLSTERDVLEALKRDVFFDKFASDDES